MLFLYKGHSKHIQEPSSFRPITLLDSAGKLMERLVLNRMTESTDLQLAPNQYEFRRSRNTLEAMEEVLRYAAHVARGMVQDRDLCVLVTLNVRNAFNLTPWGHIDVTGHRVRPSPVHTRPSTFLSPGQEDHYSNER